MNTTDLDYTFKQDMYFIISSPNGRWVAEEDFWKSKHVLRRFMYIKLIL